MLYQLSIYAMNQKELRQATILYPTLDEDHAQEPRIEILAPLYSRGQARVILRPVNLMYLERLISSSDTRQNEREKIPFAKYRAFGE